MAPLTMRKALAVVRVVVAAGAMIVLSTPAYAQVSEAAVEAAFLPRFARYVTWPPAAMPRGSDPFILCVLGVDPLGPMLDTAVRSQTVNGRRIVVRRLSGATGADGCHIAFVEHGKSQSAAQILAALANKAILTVTDRTTDAPHGIIHFVLADGHVRFLIDQAGAASRGISINSRLLALAVGVNQK